MPRSYDSLALDVAVVDAVGHLIAFIGQDGALMGNIDLAINKAVTARMFDGPASQAQSGKPSFGIKESDAGKVVIFDAGIPVTIGGNIVGAVEASAETIEQDVSVADAAAAALRHPTAAFRSSRVTMRRKAMDGVVSTKGSATCRSRHRNRDLCLVMFEGRVEEAVTPARASSGR